MEKVEFIERTGLMPTDEEYEEIERLYYGFYGGKDEFCERIAASADLWDIVRMHADTVKWLEAEIKRLEAEAKKQEAEAKKQEAEARRLAAELDKEQEWRPCSGGTNMDQEAYESLLHAGGTKELTENEAKSLIYDAFGFAPHKISIIPAVYTYEASRHHKMRKSQSYKRKALYNATDWNYIRFDCAGWRYEMVDGNLRAYED